MAERENDSDFGAGAVRVANMIEMATERGMDLQTLRSMVKAYREQLTEWQVAGSPGEPPSGFALVGEFMYKQRQEE